MIYVAILSLLVISAFYLLIFSRLARHDDDGDQNEASTTNASIVICYHNEENNVEKHLPHILRQSIQEWVLVDDNSSDGTMEKLNVYRNDKIKIISFKKDTPGKKQALKEGLDQATNEIVLLTDADCKPSTDDWSLHMCKSPKDFVLGYGPMNKISGWIPLFSRYETYMAALQYLSYARVGIPYMGVGRNMRINKSIVLKQNNRVKGSHLASGDDDLMINALANGLNTEICIHPDSFVYSNPQNTLKSFLTQKTRHMGTSFYYKPIHKVLLTLFGGAQILFYLTVIVGLATETVSLQHGIILVLVKWTIQQSINYPVMKKLKEADLFWRFPFLDILFFVYLLLLPVFYFFNKNNSRWS